jgi:hypothetical protein
MLRRGEGLTIQFHPVTKVKKDWKYIFSSLYVIHSVIINEAQDIFTFKTQCHGVIANGYYLEKDNLNFG